VVAVDFAAVAFFAGAVVVDLAFVVVVVVVVLALAVVLDCALTFMAIAIANTVINNFRNLMIV
jgi:hypothetical protein